MTSGTPEQRRFPRREARTSLSGTLTLSGRPYSAVLVDHSFDGMAVRVPKSFVSRMEKDGKEIELLFDKQQLVGEVAHSRVDPSEGAVIGISLGGRGGNGSPSFATHDPGWDLIENPETLNNIFTDLAFKGPEVPLHVHTLGGEFSLSITEVRDDRFIAERTPPSKRVIPQGRGSFRFEIFQTSHSFESTIRSIDGSTIEIDRPKQVARLLRRETFRVRNGSNNIHVRVRCLGFFLGTKPFEFDAYDLSEHGVGIADHDGMLAFPRGFSIEEMEIETSTGEKIAAKGSIRASRWDRESNAFIVGLYIETKTDAERTAWHNTILSARYPSLSFQYQPSDHAEIWSLFERSGYLHLTSEEGFTHILDVTRRTWNTLSTAGTKWSKRAMIRLNDKVAGHVQMDQIYPNTWCVHHLAIDPKISKLVAKEIYAVITDVLLAEGGQYLINFTESSKPWNQRSYYDFVSEYRFPEHNQLKTFEIYEADLNAAITLNYDSKIEVQPATRHDLGRISRFFEMNLPMLERSALSLDPETLLLTDMAKSASDVGLERGREFLVASRDGNFLGFAQIETGSDGVNIVGILDILYLHIAPNKKEIENSVRDALILKSLDRYRTLKRTKVILALEDRRPEHYEKHGIKFVTDATRWIAKRDILPRYYAFSQLLYGHLVLRRQKIKTRHSES